jgi:hypothetical protein
MISSQDALWYIIKKSKKFYDKTGTDLYATRFLEIRDLVDFKYRV